MSQHKAQNNFNNFEQSVLPYLDSAYNLARWLTRNDQDAEDVVQEASLRAFKYFDSFNGDNSRTWLLAIVRNTCYTWMKRNRPPESPAVFDEEAHAAATSADWPMLNSALAALPPEYREVVILHGLEGLTYREIAEVADIPIGTVMSRLARARKQLQTSLGNRVGERV
jgi:RNA polymerase sigma-70 factor (ECF subfamily)